MKYNIGDKVRVRMDLKDNEEYGGDTFIEDSWNGKNSMGKLKGTVCTITGVFRNKYKLLEDGELWNWTEEMLEDVSQESQSQESLHVSKYKVGDKVRVRGDLVDGVEYGLEKFVANLRPEIEITTSLRGMWYLKGKSCTISKVFGTRYKLEEDTTGWNWTEEMFDDIESEGK